MTVIINIDGVNIGSGHPPYVIAEMSANHNGSIDNAFKIIDAAKSSGANAVKLQTYKPDTITLDIDKPEFRIEGGLWNGQTLFQLYKEAHMPWDWHKPLFDYANKLNMTIFSSPFDKTAVDLLEDLNTPAYKIASFEAIDLPLIKYVASTNKPMIISTGMADEEEIEEAIDSAKAGGCNDLAILHCVSGYPAPSSDYNLKTLSDMRTKFNLVIGLSDHTTNNTVAISSVALGSSIIEKHVTLDRKGGGPDDSFSLEPQDLTSLVKDLKTAWEALGGVNYGRKSSEQGNVQFRRSLYFIKDMNKGDLISEDNTKSIRPGFGLEPKYHHQIIGKRVSKDILNGTAVSWELIEK